MVTAGYNPDTGKALYKNSKQCEGCCWIPTYASNYCSMFLNPTPATWNSGTVYNLYDCIAYGGDTYYSTIADNYNNTPPADGKWVIYTACGNTDWNSIPPYGGIDKTPGSYAVALKAYIYFDNVGDYYYKWWVNSLFILHYSAFNCHYSVECQNTEYSWDIYNSLETTSGTSTEPFNAILQLGNWSGTLPWWGYDIIDGDTCTKVPTTILNGAYFLFHRTSAENDCYDKSYPRAGILLPICTETGGGISDTASVDCSIDIGGGSYENYQLTIAWRPLDCNYTTYSESVDYNVDDCVGYNGHLFKCCLTNGPTTGAGVQNPSALITTCGGGSYWRLVI